MSPFIGLFVVLLEDSILQGLHCPNEVFRKGETRTLSADCFSEVLSFKLGIASMNSIPRGDYSLLDSHDAI